VSDHRVLLVLPLRSRRQRFLSRHKLVPDLINALLSHSASAQSDSKLIPSSLEYSLQSLFHFLIYVMVHAEIEVFVLNIFQ
jgi:hypothetical protein